MNTVPALRLAAVFVLAALAVPGVAQESFFPDSEWRAWSRGFLAEVDRDARVARIPPRGSVAGERTAMAIARDLWAQEFGREVAEAARPYRAFQGSNRWLVTGTQGIARPGDGPILVLTRDSGAVVMLRLPKSVDQAASDDDPEDQTR